MVFNSDFSLEHCKTELRLPGGIWGFFFFYQPVKHRALGVRGGGEAPGRTLGPGSYCCLERKLCKVSYQKAQEMLGLHSPSSCMAWVCLLRRPEPFQGPAVLDRGFYRFKAHSSTTFSVLHITKRWPLWWQITNNDPNNDSTATLLKAKKSDQR